MVLEPKVIKRTAGTCNRRKYGIYRLKEYKSSNSTDVTHLKTFLSQQPNSPTIPMAPVV